MPPELSRFVSSALENPQGLLFLVFSLAVALAVIVLSYRISNLAKGADGKSLEGVIRTLHERVEKLESHAKTTNTTLTNINSRVTRAVQGVSVERFDPFQNAGGQQSFATALLNEKGDGVVISGIHARDGVRVYAKEVKEFKSKRELSEEEQTAIARAHSSL